MKSSVHPTCLTNLFQTTIDGIPLRCRHFLEIKRAFLRAYPGIDPVLTIGRFNLGHALVRTGAHEQVIFRAAARFFRLHAKNQSACPRIARHRVWSSARRDLQELMTGCLRRPVVPWMWKLTLQGHRGSLSGLISYRTADSISEDPKGGPRAAPLPTSRLGQRRKGHSLVNPASLDERVDEIRWNIAKGFGFSVGPADAHFIHLAVPTQSKMQPQIVL
jgi:hypothetical protein